MATILGGVTGRLPFSLAEVLCAVLLAWAIWKMGRFWSAVFARRTSWRKVATGAGRLVGGAGCVYLAFLFLWGLNYHRPPVAASLGLTVRPPDSGELEALCDALVGEADALREGLGEDERGALRLADGFKGALKRASPEEGPPKTVLVSPLLSYLGIAGIFVPFTGEATVNRTLPHCEVPFSASHELAHRRGFAREDEANYLAYTDCRRHPDRDFQYSGTFVAGLYSMSALCRADPAACKRIEARRSAAVQRDVQALAEWQKRYESRAGRVQQKVNDAYLRAQGQRDGVRSYGRMVDLLLAERRAGRRAPAQ